jgi:hypothetical protein
MVCWNQKGHEAMGRDREIILNPGFFSLRHPSGDKQKYLAFPGFVV